MASIATNCSQCGQHIIGIKHTYGGKVYCDKCYRSLMDELKKKEEDKVDLLQYICQLFGISEIPDSVIAYLDREINNGKKSMGIKATLWWYFSIENHPLTAIENLKFVISEQYENALKYIISMKQLQKQNKEVDLNVPPLVVKVSPEKQKKEWKPNYRMEDL